ncbi:MAG: hypothetical protein KDK70_08640, partial [Myxococcales bacterium]|nr:hypothetical protein [Myxococcales bacterium]
RPGDALIEGWILAGISTELGLRLSLAPSDDPQRPSLHVELAPADAPGRHAVATERLRLSYRSPAAAPVPPALGLRVCEAVAERVRANEGPVLDALAEAARDDLADLGPAGRRRAEEISRWIDSLPTPRLGPEPSPTPETPP